MNLAHAATHAPTRDTGAPSRARQLANFAVFEAAWFACIVGVAHGRPAWGTAAYANYCDAAITDPSAYFGDNTARLRAIAKAQGIGAGLRPIACAGQHGARDGPGVLAGGQGRGRLAVAGAVVQGA